MGSPTSNFHLHDISMDSTVEWYAANATYPMLKSTGHVGGKTQNMRQNFNSGTFNLLKKLDSQG